MRPKSRWLPSLLPLCLALWGPAALAQGADDEFALPDGILPPLDEATKPAPSPPAPLAPAKGAPPAPAALPAPAKVTTPAPPAAPAPVVAPVPVVAPAARVTAPAPAPAPAAAADAVMALRERPEAPVPTPEAAPAEQALARQAFQLAITLRSGPQPDTALPQLDAALAHDPRYARAYVSRGGLALLGNRLQDAVFDFQRALQVEPSSALPLYGVGRAYEKAGDRAKACEYYRRFGASNAPDASTKLQEQAVAACR